MSVEFDAQLATSEWERDKADWVKSMGAASKLAATYQHRAEAAEAALAFAGDFVTAKRRGNGNMLRVAVAFAPPLFWRLKTVIFCWWSNTAYRWGATASNCQRG